MKKLAALLVLLTFIAIAVTAQTTIKGSVMDTTSKKPVQNVVLALLRQKDSVLYKFVRSDEAGNFTMNNIKTGDYVLMITHPLYAEYVDNIEVKNAELTLGNISITPKSKLLEEVIVKSGTPIKIKGDTITYTADSFKVKEGANVEALLKKLPGIQVDKNGKITAMGEEVKKVLVDGEEFFGDDPGVAVKNLRADAVKEVQVFDKKSDQAAFTGIDDGEKNKTINLKLKEDRKKGYFGKAELSGGLKDNYNNSAMLNAFKGKRKFATYGIMSNTGQTNLDWDDAQNYGGGMDGLEMGMSDDGGMYMSYNGGDGDDNYWGGRNGIPKNWNAGVHYSNKFDAKKQSLNMGYKFSKVNAPAGTTTYSKTFLPDTSWNTNSISNSFSSKIKHAFNLTYEISLDSMNSLKITGKFGANNTQSSSDYYSEAVDANVSSKFINNSTRKSNNKSDNNSIAGTVLWKHKFKKIFRTISINTDFSRYESDNSGFLYSLNNFFTSGNIYKRDTVDQKNIRNNIGLTSNTRIAYTEPLIKDMYLELNYTISASRNSNDRTSLKKGLGDYTQVIDSLSNHFDFNKLVNKPGVNLRYNKKKYTFSIGSTFAFNHFIQNNVTKNQNYNYDFSTFFPSASFSYKLKGNKNVRLYYNGSGTAPTAEQLQPIKDNTDPLNVVIGNPDLKQSFQHSFGASYNFYDMLKEKNLWSNLNISTTQHSFAQYSYIDTLGRRNSQTVNVNGAYYVNLYMQYGFKLKKPNLRLGFSPRFNGSRNIDFVNGIKNVTNNQNYGFSVNVNKEVDKKYSISLGPQFSYTHATATVNSSANANFWLLGGYGDVDITLPWKLEFSTDANFEIRQKDPRFDKNTNYTKWNASLEKNILKDVFVAKVQVFDILDQNRGYNRNFTSYNFTESFYNTLRRYWMLTLTWNFSKNGKPAEM
ncbi:MAG: outer membrane beta-barrel family protein [Ferruginibacter sp.]